MNDPFAGDPVLGFAQLSEILGVNATTLRAAKSRGRLPVSVQGHIGNMTLFNRAEAQAYAAVLAEKRRKKEAKRKA